MKHIQLLVLNISCANTKLMRHQLTVWIKKDPYLIVILAISMTAAGINSIIPNVTFVRLLTSIWSIVIAESAHDNFLLDAAFRKIETSWSSSTFDQPYPSGISPLAARFNAL